MVYPFQILSILGTFVASAELLGWYPDLQKMVGLKILKVLLHQLNDRYAHVLEILHSMPLVQGLRYSIKLRFFFPRVQHQ